MIMSGDWDDIINEAEAEHFVGREQELESFLKMINPLLRPKYVIFYVTGQGGAGKTTLLNRCKALAEVQNYLLVDTDEQQHDVAAVLGRFARQFAELGHPLKHFDERYKVYRQKMEEIENDPQAPQGWAAMLGRAMIRSTYIIGDMVPGLRKGLEYLPREAIETQASEWADYLAKKLSNKDELALVRDPTPILTALFFEDLNELAQKWPILLSFENFEATRQELQEWLLRLREYKPSLRIKIAIAARNPPGAAWDPIRKITLVVRLDTFTQYEANAFLDVNGIVDEKRRSEIINWSGRLPVLMSWLASPGGTEPDPNIPTHDIVERFLRWITDTTLRQVALLAAVPRVFNSDVLTLLLKQDSPSSDGASVFEWLQMMPFVQQHEDGWHYHEVVRRMMLKYQRLRSPQFYGQTHMLLAHFYERKREELQSSEEEQWKHELWREYTLSYIYHLIASDPHQHWKDVMSLFAVALRKHRSFARELIEGLDKDDVHDELTHEQRSLLQVLKQQLAAITTGSLKDGYDLFERLSHISGLSSQAKGYIFAYRGEAQRLARNYEKALYDFEEALLLLPQDSLTLGSRGETYRLIGRYEEALVDFDQAIALDEEFSWAIALRGETYRLLERYEEALVDFDRAISLNEKSSWTIAHRGETYRLLGRYEEALADFDRANALGEKLFWVIGSRGETYRAMGHHEEALADFSQAITLDEKSSWAITRRGQTYCLLKRYEEALADFDRAIALDEKSSWAIGSRGETYRLIGRYEEALADFDCTIALDEKSSWAIAHRGETYRLLKRYEEALADFDQAITLGEKSSWAIGSRGETYRLLKRYEEALVDFDQAIALDEEFSWAITNRGETYRAMGRYKEALVDFDRAIALDEKSSWAIAHRGETYRLMGRYEEALIDFDQAIMLGEKSSWAIGSRGETYRLLKRYEEALVDFDQAIALDEEFSWAITNRGETYRLIGRFEEALVDFDRAIALDEKSSWAIIHQGETYRAPGHHEKAQINFDQYVALDDSSESVPDRDNPIIS